MNMRRLLTGVCGVAICASFFGPGAHAAAQPDSVAAQTLRDEPKPAKKPLYDESADAKQQIAAALAKAKRENRRVLIQWGGNWCSWCI